MDRLRYKNVAEMRREWKARVAAHRFMTLPDSLARLKAFLDDFDIAKPYSEAWWKKMLNCRFTRPSLTERLDLKDFELGLVRAQVWDLLNNFVCYTVPTIEALDDIKHFVDGRTVHEHMAGSGYWAYQLQKRGVSVLAFDKSNDVYGVSHAKTFTYVDVVNARTAKLPHDAVLMLSWVPNGSNAPIDLLKQMGKGQRLVYIADWGCCGGTVLHKYLEEHFEAVKVRGLPRMMPLNDTMWLYERL